MAGHALVQVAVRPITRLILHLDRGVFNLVVMDKEMLNTLQQRVVIVRGQGKGKNDRGPYNIVLFNVSSGERGEFGPAVWYRIGVGHSGRAEARWLSGTASMPERKISAVYEP